MDLLREVSKTGDVRLTQLSRKLTIAGKTNSYQVYRIRLDLLHYNAQNDRIATWISQYKAEHNGQLPKEDDYEAYNQIIEGFIVKSNEEAIKKTSNHIKMFGQQVAGVVLSDGLIIDGNRRFTCLRRLAKEDPAFDWIEAVILPKEIAQDPKRIKILELNLQHAEEEKVAYDPVERLVGVYNDVIHGGLLTVEEYAKNTNIPVRDVSSMGRQAKLMTEFLEFIGAKDQFYIARELSIGGPLVEVDAILKQCPDYETEETVKKAMFANIAVEPAGDITRHVRKFRKILQSEGASRFIEEQKGLAVEVEGKLKQMPEISKDAIQVGLRSNEELMKRFVKSIEDAEVRQKSSVVLASPTENIQKVISLLDDIDTSLFERINLKRRQQASKDLSEIIERAQDLLKKLEDLEKK